MTALTPIMGPFGHILSRCDGHLIVDSTPLRGPAWWLVDFSAAWRYGDRRGAGVVLPYIPGDRAYRRRRAGTMYTFQVAFGGTFNTVGAPSSTTQVKQMYANFASLRGAIVVDPGTPTRASTLTTPDEVDHAAPVQVLDLSPGVWSAGVGSGEAHLLSSLQIFVPSGGWV